MPASQIDDDIGPLPEHAGNTLLPADAAVRRALVDGRQRILGYLLRRLGDRDVAEEVFQRFVLRALEHSAEINDVAAVHGWLGRVLASAVADRQRDEARRRRRETATGEEDLARLTVAPDRKPWKQPAPASTRCCPPCGRLMRTWSDGSICWANRGRAQRATWGSASTPWPCGCIAHGRRYAGGWKRCASLARCMVFSTAGARRRSRCRRASANGRPSVRVEGDRRPLIVRA